MTLPRFGIRYETWSDTQLKEFAQQRSLELTRDTRNSWIRTLRAKDRSATITFLEFPPEIRNVVYELLLTQHHLSRKRPAVCYPSILATCKQINEEAADMLVASYQNISVPLDISLQPHMSNKDRSSYRVKVSLNHKVLGKGQQGDRAFTILWPQSLAKLRSLDIRVSMYAAGWHVPIESLPSGRELTRICSAGESQINHALYELYHFLGKCNDLQQLNVMVTSMLPGTSKRHEELLSPACAIASMAKESKISVHPYGGRLQEVGEVMQSTVDAFRDIRDLEQEVMLHTGSQQSLPPNSTESTGALLSKPSFRSDILALCELLTSVRHSDSLCIFPHLEELDGDVKFMKRHLFDAKIEEVQERITAVVEKLKQLRRNEQEVRRRRRSKAESVRMNNASISARLPTAV